MLIKSAIIGAVLLIGGFVFSSEISALFPNTSESVPEALHNDTNHLGSKVADNVGQKIDDSIHTVELRIGDSVSNSIESSKETIGKTIKPNQFDSIGNFFRNLIYD